MSCSFDARASDVPRPSHPPVPPDVPIQVEPRRADTECDGDHVELRVNLSLWQFLGILIAFLIVSSALLFGLVGGVWLLLQTLRALTFLVYAPLQWTWRKTTYRPRHLPHREGIEDSRPPLLRAEVEEKYTG